MALLVAYTALLALAAPRPTAADRLPACAAPATDEAAAELVFWNATVNGTLFYVLQPPAVEGKPLVVFMHGLTAHYEMYEPFLRTVVAAGFAVVYPFIKNPAADAKPWTTNTNGEFVRRAAAFAAAEAARAGSALRGLDAARVALVGHSMGATSTIAAAALHPGVCGPFGPPPLPSTWMPTDLATIVARMPLVVVSARNDAAFWPAPHTAEHEEGCFEKGLPADANPGHGAAFAVFSEASCAEDHKREPFPDGGHNCIMKTDSPEAPWVRVALQLYLAGSAERPADCEAALWGDGPGSLP